MQQNAIEPMCRLLNCKDVQVSIWHIYIGVSVAVTLLQVIQVILDGLSNILKVYRIPLLVVTVIILLLHCQMAGPNVSQIAIAIEKLAVSNSMCALVDIVV